MSAVSGLTPSLWRDLLSTSNLANLQELSIPVLFQPDDDPDTQVVASSLASLQELSIPGLFQPDDDPETQVVVQTLR
jgi:hypothetical protein